MRMRSVALALAAAATAVFAGAVPAQARSTSYNWYTGCGIGGPDDRGHASVSSTTISKWRVCVDFGTTACNREWIRA